MSDISGLTPKQQAVYDCLPETRKNIAEHLGISRRSVRYRMDAIEEDTPIEFERDSDGVWCVSGSSLEEDEELPSEDEETEQHGYTQAEEPSNGRAEEGRNTEVLRENTYEKAQATKEINNELLEIEREIKQAIQDVPHYNTDFERTKGNSTLVIPRSDDHFGAKVESRSVNAEFTTEIAKDRIEHTIDSAISSAHDREEYVEDVVLGLFGDHIEGEYIFNNQIAHLDEFLREQIKEASTFYVNQIEKLCHEFENVKVVTCPGNHGRTSGVTNADDIVFDWIQTGLQWKDVDNVEFVESNGKYVEFNIRDFDGYARHGTDALKHASTTSGDDRWMNWKEESPFDIAYHGHHHELRVEPVGHSQVFQCGTPVPPSLFVNSIGETGKPRTMFHFTTDEKVIEGLDILEF